MSSKKSIAVGKKHESQLSEMRRKLNAKQRQLLNAFWQEQQASGKWPLTRIINSRCGGKQEVRKQLRELGGHIVFEKWCFTPKGVQYLAEIQSLKNNLPE